MKLLPHKIICYLQNEIVVSTDLIYAFYSTAVFAGGAFTRGSGLATMLPAALSTYGDGRSITKVAEVIPGSEQVENPKILFDAARGIYYQYLDHIGLSTRGEFTVSQVMYWSNSLTVWPTDQKTTIVAGGVGGWDSTIIGTMSSGVVKDGVLYATYDALNDANFAASGDGGFNARDIGVCDAVWPFNWGTGIQLNGSLRSVECSYGTSVVRARFIGDGVIGLDLNGVVKGVQRSTSDELLKTSGGSSGLQRITNQTKIFTFVRNQTQIFIYCDGQLVDTVVNDFAVAKIYVSGNIVVEELYFVPPVLGGAASTSEIINSVDGITLYLSIVGTGEYKPCTLKIAPFI